MAKKAGTSYDEFVGKMRKNGRSEPTAAWTWRGNHENYLDLSNNMNPSSLHNAAFVFQVYTGMLLPK